MERKGQGKEEVSRGLDMGIGHEGLLWKGQAQRKDADMVRNKGLEEEKESARILYQEGSTLISDFDKSEGRRKRVQGDKKPNGNCCEGSI